MRKQLPVTHQLIVYSLFFISGFCALVYEVVWSRMLVLVMGNTTLAAGAILTAFMAGLSLGGVYWGRRVDKTGLSPLRLFGFLEAGVGIGALIVSRFIWFIVPLESLVSTPSDPGGFVEILARFVACFCVLGVPTFLMGGTLAVIGKHVVSRGGRFGFHLAGLYGINTAGSFIGAFVAGFFLIRYFGHTGSLLTAAVLNCLVGIVAILGGGRGRAPDTTVIRPRDKMRPPPGRPLEPSGKTAFLVLIGLGVSGFCAIVYQVLWTRLLILIIDNSVYSFTIILMGFLAGIALGSLVAAGCFRYFRNLVLLFALALMGIGGTAFCFPFFVHLKPNAPDLSYLKFLLSTLPLGLFLPTLIMGIAFPIGTEIYRRHRGDVGKSIGVAYAVNTAGCVLGGLTAGFFFIGILGFQKSMLVLSGLNMGVGVLIGALNSKTGMRLGFMGAAIACAVLMGLTMPPDYFAKKYAQLEPRSRLVYYRESMSTTATVFERPDRNRVLYLNGIPEVDTSPLSIKTFKLMGALPGLLHEDPEKALMITFGAGVAAGTTALFTDHLDCVDLASQAAEIAPRFNAYNNKVINNSRMSLFSDDARHFLLTGRNRYSIIISDATHPRVYDSWVLFTREFYHLVSSRLTGDGIFLQWLPFHGLTTEQYLGIVRTFSNVFSHTTLWRVGQGYTLLLSSPRPLKIDYQSLLKKLAEPAVQRDLRSAGLDNPFELLGYFAMGTDAIAEMVSGSELVMTDDSPAHLFFPFSATFRDQYDQWPLVNYRKIKEYEESVVPFLENISDSPVTRKRVADAIRYYEYRSG